MPLTETFRFRQIQHFLLNLQKKSGPVFSVTPFESWCSNLCDSKGGISLIYTALASSSTKTQYMINWEKDLQFNWKIDTWHSCLSRAGKGPLNLSLIEANLKIILRWYLVPSRLSKAYPQVSPLCFRGCDLMGSIFHIFWECPRIRSFWNKVFHMIRKITGTEIAQDPFVAILGILPSGIPKHIKSLINFFLIATKLTIAKAWKRPSVSWNGVKQKINWIMVREKISHNIDNSTKKFELIWEPWANYMNVSI